MLKSSQNIRFWQRRPNSYIFAVGGVACTTAILWICGAENNLANVFMIYILVVIVTAVQVGRMAAVVAALTSFGSIDFFFAQPIFHFTIDDPTKWLALIVFLIVAIITGELTARLRTEVQNTLQHDTEMTTLAETSWQVASEYDNEIALRRTLENMAKVLDLNALAVILIQDDGSLKVHCTFGLTDTQAQELVQGSNIQAIEFVRNEAIPMGPYAPNVSRVTNINNGSSERSEGREQSIFLANEDSTFLPIHIDGAVKGIVYLRSSRDGIANPRERQMLQALVNHIVLILQREKSFAAEARAQALLEANKLKSALLSMVSHDFRSPLTSIKASIQTLKSAGDELSVEVSRTLLDAVDEETERINKMVTNILDLSRLESGAWGPKYESIPMTELLGSVLSSFSERANSRILTKNLVGAESVYVDVVQIEQVLKNLLENALKYSPSDSQVELICRLEADTLIVEVLDRGIGLAEGEESRVFEPFYRGKKLSESNVPGVGIGLSICKGLAEAHGGMISASRREGGGSVFRVSLPNRQPETLSKH